VHPQRRHHVLIVDDEDGIVFTLVRTLYRDNERLDVLGAQTAEIAQQIMREIPIDVLVTDIMLPGMSGLDLVFWASVESPHTRVIVMTGFPTPEAHDRALRLGCLRFISKPFEGSALRKLVLELLDQPRSISGSLSGLSPADLIQMLCLGGQTTALRVIDGPNVAQIHIKQGQIVHAVWNRETGEQALYKALAAQKGMFTSLPFPEKAPETITLDWQHLLIEGMRVLDEQQDRESPSEEEFTDAVDEFAVNMDSVARASAGEGERASDPVGVLIDEGFTAVRQGDLELARDKWEEARRQDPQNRTIELNLKRLEQLEREAARPARRKF
jgi:DNA-binding response OmpR family regulator